MFNLSQKAFKLPDSLVRSNAGGLKPEEPTSLNAFIVTSYWVNFCKESNTNEFEVISSIVTVFTTLVLNNL